ncbi:MAK10-like protein [Tanacetum coccineum]
MGDENSIRTLGDYSRPSHEGYRNNIDLHDGNNVVPLRSDTIRLVQNGCSFHRLCEINRAAGDKLRDKNAEESWEIIKNLALYDHEGWNDSGEFAKPVKTQQAGCSRAFESGDRKEEMKDGMDDELARSPKEELIIWEMKAEVVVETPRSRHIGYYLKHEINEKLIEGFVDNQKYNDSLLATRLGIAEDVLVEITGYVYPVDFVILEIKEDEKKPFILGTPFLTTAKAKIRFDKETITLRLYLMRRSPKVLRSFMWTILG